MFGKRSSNALLTEPEPEPIAGVTLDTLRHGEQPPDSSEPLAPGHNKQLSNVVNLSKNTIQPLLLDRIDAGATSRMDRAQLRDNVSEIVSEIAVEEKLQLNQAEQGVVVTLLMHDMLGLGPLEPLLADESITDILVNGAKQIYIEAKGKLELSDVTFRDDAHVMNIATRIVSRIGRRIDESVPLVNARLEEVNPYQLHNCTQATTQRRNTMIWIAVLIFVAVFALFAVILLSLSGHQDRIAEQRLALLEARATGHAQEALLEKKHRDLYQQKNKPEASLENFFESLLPRKEKLIKRLQQAGLDIEPGRYLLNSLFAACFGFFIATGLFESPLSRSFITAGIFGLVLPHLYLNRLIKKRRLAFLNSFPDALDLIVRSLKAGLPISQSMQAVAEEMKGPLSDEFTQIDDEIRLSKDLEDSLWDASGRVDLPDFRFFVISLSAQRQTSGNLAETLDNLSEIVRKRRQLSLKIKAMSSEARASAYIIGALPFVMMSLLYLLNRDYVSILFTDPRGHKLLMVGASLLFTGAMVMRKMVRFEV